MFHLSLIYFLVASPAPSKAPDVIIANNSSSTSLIVTWSHVSTDDFDGQYIGYQITYFALNSDSEFYLATVNYTTNLTELTNLTAFTVYVVTVSAVSSGGVGPKALAIAQTDEAGKIDYFEPIMLI